MKKYYYYIYFYIIQMIRKLFLHEIKVHETENTKRL